MVLPQGPAPPPAYPQYPAPQASEFGGPYVRPQPGHPPGFGAGPEANAPMHAEDRASAVAPNESPPSAAEGSGSRNKLVGFLACFDMEACGQYWVLRRGRLSIGRQGAAEGLDVAIAHPTVSSNHALLELDPEQGRFQLEDCNSANGTLINCRPIAGRGPREVRDGDKLRFGAVNLILKLLADACPEQ